MRLLTAMLLACVCSMAAMAQDNGDSVSSEASVNAEPDAGSDSQNSGNAGQQAPQQPPQQTAHPAAVTYSSGYELRLKIHKYASFATLPLFATELALGQSLYNDPARGSNRTAHGIVGAGIVGLFAANTVTGVWNLWESRSDPNGRRLRMLHSVLMLAANGGFVAAAATAPSDHRGNLSLASGKALHRDIAVASIGVGTVGYVLMLFKGK